MILMAARQSKNVDIDFIGELCDTGMVSQITLNGLGTSDIDKIILQNCGEEVDRVSPSIVNVVQVNELAYVYVRLNSALTAMAMFSFVIRRIEQVGTPYM